MPDSLGVRSRGLHLRGRTWQGQVCCYLDESGIVPNLERPYKYPMHVLLALSFFPLCFLFRGPTACLELVALKRPMITHLAYYEAHYRLSR